MVVALNGSENCKKPSLLWLGPPWTTEANNDYAHQVEEIQNNIISVASLLLKLFSDALLNSEVILLHVLQPTFSRRQQYLLIVVGLRGIDRVSISWRASSTFRGTEEPLQRTIENDPASLIQLINRKWIIPNLVPIFVSVSVLLNG